MKNHIHKIQNILLKSREEFLNGRILSVHKIKVLDSLEACRTITLGSHIDDCPNCDYVKISYNSCRNRHCPTCQNLAKEQWIDARRSELIDTSYFHIVFTLPEALNPIIYSNQKLLYDLLFKCVSQTLTELSLDPKYLGAQIGITAVLHTWGQNMMYHPHIHCIVPGGGLLPSGTGFKHSRKKFFLPVRVISKMFRGKFLSHLKSLISQNEISIPLKLTQHEVNDIICSSYEKDWVVYCKKPFKSPSHVIEYLGRYTHKVAISNSRIVSDDGNFVTFKWRDYRDKNKEKIMTLSSVEFIRRFLLHVLPKKFFKIRYYGILSTRTRKTKLLKCQKLTKIDLSIFRRHSKEEILKSILGESALCCPKCACTKLNRRFIPYSVKRE